MEWDRDGPYLTAEVQDYDDHIEKTTDGDENRVTEEVQKDWTVRR